MSGISRRDALAAGAGLLPLFGFAAMARGQVVTPGGAVVPVDPAAPVVPRSPAVRGAAAPLDGLDTVMAAELLIMGAKQIALCRFALERLQDEDVQAFAQAEIDEHEMNRKSLNQLGYEYPATPGADEPAGGDVSVGRVVLTGESATLVHLKHDVAEQCVGTQKSELGKLRGAALDERFVNNQLDAHYALYDHALVFEKKASPRMLPVLQASRPVIERHIATCKELLAELAAAGRTS